MPTTFLGFGPLGLTVLETRHFRGAIAVNIGDIEKLVVGHGAVMFGYHWEPGAAIVEFVLQDYRIRFRVQMPDPRSPKFTRTPTGKPRSRDISVKEYNAEVSKVWAALHDTIASRLRSVQRGVERLEIAFLGQLVARGGKTLADQVFAAIDEYKIQALPSGEE